MQAGPIQSPEPWARWRLTVRFNQGSIEAAWRVQVIEGENTVLAETSLPILCTPYGNVTIGQNTAYINGGFIRCETGHFANTVASISALNIEPMCRTESVWSRMEGEPNFNVAAEQPIFYQPNGSISHTLIGDPTVFTTTMQLDAGAYAYTESSFQRQLGLNQLGSIVNDCIGGLCEAKHWANNSLLSNQYIDAELPMMTTGITEIFIGTDNTNFYRGTLNWWEFDPSCPGTPQG